MESQALQGQWDQREPREILDFLVKGEKEGKVESGEFQAIQVPK